MATKHFLLLIILFCVVNSLSAQYVYTIKADSVKITGCDSAELIIENHSQAVKGFLYNTGNGRTVFRRGVVKLSDSAYVIGADTLQLHPGNFWSLTGNVAVDSINFIGTRNNVPLYFRINNITAGKIDSATMTTALGYKAGSNIRTARWNTAFGYQALMSAATGVAVGNTAIGFEALRLNTSALNTALGYWALPVNTAPNNTAVGAQTMAANTTGSSNTALGTNTLIANTTGRSNVGLGYSALYSANTASNNIGIGSNAGRHFRSGIQNIFIGDSTALQLQSGNYNTIIGSRLMALPSALNNNIIIADGQGNRRINVDSTGNLMVNTLTPLATNTFSGSGNFSGNLVVGNMTDNGARLQVNGKINYNDSVSNGVYQGTTPMVAKVNNNHFGFGALVTTLTGSNNMGMGNGALASITTGSDNTGIGNGALASIKTVSRNTAIGSGALTGGTGNGGTGNTAVGYHALFANTGGTSNVGAGSFALGANTSGTNNVAVGPGAMSTSTTGHLNVAIGNSALVGNTSGTSNVGIGTQSGFLSSTGSNNLFLGANADIKDAAHDPLDLASAIGYNAKVASSYSMVLGGTGLYAIRVGICTETPTARLQIGPPSDGSDGSAPLKLVPGTLIFSMEDGAIEYDGTDLYATVGTTRYKLAKTLAGQITTSFGGAAVAAFNSVTTTVSLAGVQPGDIVSVSANTGAVNPRSVMVTGYVTSAGVVTLSAYNASNGSVTLASDTYKIRVIR